jgi:hypothetical protein
VFLTANADNDNDYEHDKKASHGGAEAQRAQRNWE